MSRGGRGKKGDRDRQESERKIKDVFDYLTTSFAII